MLEPIVVDHPTLFPATCIQCGGQTGPMLDLHREVDGYGRIYLCIGLCIKADSRIAGYTDGKRNDELDTFREAEGGYKHEIASLQKQVAELTIELGDDALHRRVQREENEALIARIRQLESRFRERNEAARADMELVGAEE